MTVYDIELSTLLLSWSLSQNIVHSTALCLDSAQMKIDDLKIQTEYCHLDGNIVCKCNVI